jgi:hypothetical protein
MLFLHIPWRYKLKNIICEYIHRVQQIEKEKKERK